MILLDFFKPVHEFLSPPKVQIDNTVFWIQHRVTVAVFIMFGILSTANTFFGNPIHCLSRGKNNLDVINNYCWVMGTYTIKELTHDKAGVAHPGVGTFDYKTHTKVYHIYYQWICFAIFFQMILFLLPRFVWKKMEGGKMMSLVGDMKNQVDGEELEKRVDKLYKSFKAEKNDNYFYFYKFVFCEILNLVNLFLQFVLTDKFLGGMFRFYGLEYVNYYFNYQGINTIDPFDLVFPKVAKCDFAKHGPGGDIIDFDVMCVLPLNIINEKIYLIMWAWLSFLLLLNLLNLFQRILTVSLPTLPNCTLKSSNVVFSGPCTRVKYRQFRDSLTPQDVFILQLFSNNIDKKTFSNLLVRFIENQEGVGTNTLKIGERKNGVLYGNIRNGEPNGDKKWAKMREDKLKRESDVSQNTMSSTDTNDSREAMMAFHSCGSVSTKEYTNTMVSTKDLADTMFSNRMKEEDRNSDKEEVTSNKTDDNNEDHLDVNMNDLSHTVYIV